MDRRTLLRWLACTPTATAPRLWAAPSGGAKFLMVMLRGGCDTLSLLVPRANSDYLAARPNIAVRNPLALDADWGLHPVLAGTLAPMASRGELVAVPFSGTEDLSRSHFETQDTIELGQPLGGRRDFRSGFLNRLVAQLGGTASAVAFTEQVPLVLQGSQPVPNLALRSLGRGGLDARQSELIASMYAGTQLGGAVREGFSARQDAVTALAGEMQAASRGAPGTQGFAQDARRIGTLLRERYDIGFVDIGGWDTHVGQGADQGQLATRLEELGLGLSGLAQAMGQAWQRTVVVVLSEFGRTFRENGNRGTDHGHGGTLLVLGGGLAAGTPVRGEQVALRIGQLQDNRDLPVRNEWRAVTAGLLAQAYGLGPEALSRVLPQARPQALGLL